MIHIAICDDEPDFIRHLTELIRQYTLETSQDIKTTVYYDGLELIEKYDPSTDLIFLDIQMRLADGKGLSRDQGNLQFFYIFYIGKIDKISIVAPGEPVGLQILGDFFHGLVADDIFLFGVKQEVSVKSLHIAEAL